MIRNVTDIISSASTQNLSTTESVSKNQFSHREDFSNLTSPLSSIKEAAQPYFPSVSDIFGDDEESWTFTPEEMNMILEADAKIDHDNMLNAIRQSAAEAMVYPSSAQKWGRSKSGSFFFSVTLLIWQKNIQNIELF